MGSSWKLFAFAVALSAAAIIAVVFTWPRATPRSATPATGACVERLLHDWRDGSIDGTYPLQCYQQTISDLPADVRIYSSAVDDIRQARADQIARTAS